MQVIDIHSDIITHIVSFREKGENQVLDRYHYKRLKAAGITCLIMVLWVEGEKQNSAFERFIQLLGAFQADLQESSRFRLIKDINDLTDRQDGKISIILGLEGLRFMEQWPVAGLDEEERINQIIAFLNSLYIRHAILCWNEINKISSGTGAKQASPLGLSSFGKKVIKRLEKEKYIIDLSHLDQTSFWDVIQETSKPVICSHSNARALCDHPRNLTDEQIKIIGARGGLIGINAIPEFVDPANPSLERFIDHIDYIANLIGIEHVAFGFDFVDYLETFKHDLEDRKTVGLESAICVPKLLKHLQKRGYLKEEIETMASGNFLRLVKQIW